MKKLSELIGGLIKGFLIVFLLGLFIIWATGQILKADHNQITTYHNTKGLRQ